MDVRNAHPLKLTSEQKGLNILYLAKFAPDKDMTKPRKSKVYPSLSRYHFDLYEDLSKLGFTNVEPTSDLNYVLKNISSFDYIFSIENSAKFRNSEVMISSLAEHYKIPYLGAPPNVRAIAEDKYLSNIFAQSLGINVPNHSIISDSLEKSFEPPFEGPFIIKPRFGVNSEYLPENCVQDSWESILKLNDEFKSQNLETVIQSFIPGENWGAPFVEAAFPSDMAVLKEINVGGNNVLTNFHKQNSSVFNQREVIVTSEIHDYLNKSNLSLRQDFGPVDYLRTDWRIHEKTNVPYLIEINICCSISRQSGVAKSCYELGWKYEDLLESIISTSLISKPSLR